MMKQVIVMRTDLGMSTGKMCAQAAHAAAMFQTRYPVIVLAIDSASALETLIYNANHLNLTVNTVHDAGKTEVDPGTLTCCGIGPNEDIPINTLTSILEAL